MDTRRNFLQTSLFSVGAMAMLQPSRLWAKPNKHPMRFIFMHRGNGLWPSMLVPPSFDKSFQEKENKKQAYEVDLDGHQLPEWMSPLANHVNHLTLLQGLSGKMCTTGHHSWCSSLGVYKANERISSIKWATVDFELSRMFPSPVGHIELACFPLGGGNARGALDGIAQGFSARGPQQPNYAFGSPRVALAELFKSVAADSTAKTQYELDRQLLKFIAENEQAATGGLVGFEKQKLTQFVDAVESIRERNQKIEAMGDVIRRHVPQLESKYLDPQVSTLDRQVGHAEVLLGALVSGLTNVVAFTLDELGHDYTGIPGIEGEKVNMHDVGHGKSFGNLTAEEIRLRTQKHHMAIADRIVTRLKSVPEGDGTMFDNTMLFYFPDSGETHHSHGTEFPFVVVAGENCKLNLGRRYVRLPNYGEPGHKTLGNWYTTILNAHGNSIDHFGDIDTGLTKYLANQKGPIESFLS